MTGFFNDDAELVEKCVKRDIAAWAALTRKYSDLISISIINRLTKYAIETSRQDIEDIRQEILASLWKERKLEGVRNRRDISYWLSIVSGNAAIAYMRRKGAAFRDKRVSLFDKIGEKEVMDLLPSTLAGPKDELIRTELSERMDKALEQLPTKERLIMKLSILHDKKHREIADILNIPVDTVSSHIRRAKDKLKKSLQENHYF